MSKVVCATARAHDVMPKIGGLLGVVAVVSLVHILECVSTPMAGTPGGTDRGVTVASLSVLEMAGCYRA